MEPDDRIDRIAELSHEINRAYCAALGDHTQAPWAEAPEWQKDSARNGVRFTLDNPNGTPEQSHESWLAQKHAEGWTYGEVKDPEKKTHPCFVPYGELPAAQRAKDYLFRAAVTHGARLLAPARRDGFAAAKSAAIDVVQKCREEGETDHRSMISGIRGIEDV